MAFSVMSRMAFVPSTDSVDEQVGEIDQLCNKLVHVSNQLDGQHLPSLFVLKERYNTLFSTLEGRYYKRSPTSSPLQQNSRIINGIYEGVLKQANGDATFLLDMTKLSLQSSSEKEKYTALVQTYLAQVAQVQNTSATTKFVREISTQDTGLFDWSVFIKMHQLALAEVKTKRQDAVIKVSTSCAVNGIDVAKLVVANDRFKLPSCVQVFLNNVHTYQSDLTTQMSDMSLQQKQPEQVTKALCEMLLKDAQTTVAISKNKTMPKIALAALIGSVKTVKALAKNNVNEADLKGYTACHMAAITANWRMLELLSSEGGDFSYKTLSGYTVYGILKAQGFSDKTTPSATQETLFQNWSQS